MKIDLSPDRVFVSSDFHAYHKNICTGTTTWNSGSCRCFENEVLMTDKLVENINNKVGAEDILIHLGDWSFGGKDKIKLFRDRINCKKIIALKGNHDYNIVKDVSLQRLFFKWYGDYDVDPIVSFKVGGHNYACSHYSLLVWDGAQHGVRNLFGHSHGSLMDNPFSLGEDVGVDCHNLTPLSFVEVEEHMSKKIWKPVDHHDGVHN